MTEFKLNKAYSFTAYPETDLPSNAFGLYKCPNYKNDEYVGECWRFNWHLGYFLFDEYHGLLNPKSWMKQDGAWHVCGTWRDFVSKNTDWIAWKFTQKKYKWRNMLLGNFIDANSSKLLNCSRNFASIRSRDKNQIYLKIEFNGFNFKVTKTFLIDKRDGKHCNQFLTAFTIEQSEVENFEYKDEVILEGVCKTEDDAKNAINKIAELVPELEWKDWLASESVVNYA